MATQVLQVNTTWSGVVDLDDTIQIAEDVTLTISAGSIVTGGSIEVYDWGISAKAKGSFVDSSGIRFSTDAEANGTDRFHYLEASFPVMDRTMNLGIRRSNLNTDTQNVLREIYASITLVLD
jgi:hypothetical protein